MIATAQVLPPAGQSGIIEKSLRDSQPQFQPPPEEEVPQIQIQDSRQVKDAGAGIGIVIRKIVTEGNTLIDDETLAPLVDVGEEGLEVTLGILALIANEVTAFYAEQGYFLTKAHIPEQEIKNGIVVMRIVEGHVGKVQVKGTDWLNSEDFVDRMQHVTEEKPLSEKTLERVLLELNGLMGVQTRSILKPGDTPGASDLILEVTESQPYRISFDGDNFGSRFTGKNRYGLTGTVAGILKLGDEFYIRGVKSNEDLTLLTSSYRFPITNFGTTLKGTITFSENGLADTLATFDGDGNALIYVLEVTQPLSRSRTSRSFFRVGVEYRTFENDQLGEKTSDDQLADIYFTFGGNLTDRFKGRTFYEARAQFGFTESDPTDALNSRFMGTGDISVFTGRVLRYQSTGLWKSYFFGKAEGQLVSGRVLSPDQKFIGGSSTVRGFPISEYAGDYGYNFTLEYVLPVPWEKPIGIGGLTLNKVLSVFAFIDHGKIFVEDPQPGERDQSITGAGVGLRIYIPKIGKDKLAPSLNFNLTYGHPVMGGPAPTDGSNGTIYAGGVLTW
jgi:hemolysin activation/secretion protein